jgi:hypothetical protein
MNTKTLKFTSDLVPLILSGTKTITWRLWDDKDLSAGDQVVFVDRSTSREFAHVRIISVVEKKLGELTPADTSGHEAYTNDEDMYDTYARYYGRPVMSETVVKIVRFELISSG